VSKLSEYLAPARWAAALVIVLAAALPAAAQMTQPVWYPPLSLYGRPVSQPYFDFPTWARYSNCRPAPLAWGYDPFPAYGACEGDAACYPGVACPGDFVAHRPSDWYATADFAPLTVDHVNGFVVARRDPPGEGTQGPAVLTTEDLEPEFAAGGKFTVGRRIFDCYRLEGTYLGKYDWNDTVIVNDPFPLISFVPDPLASDPLGTGVTGINRAILSQHTAFQSAELNLRYWADMPPGPFDVSYLVGVRYIQLNEEFNFLAFGATPIDLATNAVNDLIGVQMGIEGAFLITTRWWIDVDLKGGIYNNAASQDTTLMLGGAQAPGSPVAAERDRTSFVGDLSIVANWAITPNWNFRIGYQALFMHGVALAQDQLVAPLVSPGQGALDDTGEICFHGPIIGLTWMR
jgi:hypothetical protein